MTTTARAALLAVVALLATGLLLALPASAADVEVRLTADGPVPAEVVLPSGGGTVRFIVDDALSHTLVSDAFGEQRLGGLGQPQQVELQFGAAGAAYTDRRNRPLAPQEEPGRVSVAAPPPADAPPSAQAPEPAPSPALARRPVAVRTPTASQSGGTQPTPTREDDDDGAQPPLVAAPLPSAPLDPAPAPASESVTVASALPPVQAVEGPLPGQPTSRPLGLPAALAALAALGVASMIVRVLLAEPVARDA